MEQMAVAPYFVLTSFGWGFCLLVLVHVFEGHRHGAICGHYLHYREFYVLSADCSYIVQTINDCPDSSP